MSGHDFRQQVHERYQTINNQWLGVHFRLLLYCTLVSGAVEILMFFIISRADMLTYSAEQYWLKYVLVPLVLNTLIVFTGYLVLRRKRLSAVAKQYVISFLFLALSLVLALMHSGFIAVLVVATFPILVTIVYEDQKLTALIAVFACITQAVSGYSTFWDPDKKLNGPYKINLIVLIVAVFCTWLTCKFMIDFMKMKREIILSNDIERFRLQRDINMDGLTGVGNKLALMARLNEHAADFEPFDYLAMLDLDDFKKINDAYGHLFGDDVLRCMGEALRGMVNGAQAYRYGGDEFCAVFAGMTLESVLEEISAVQAYFPAHLTMPDDYMSIRISAGVTGYSCEKTVTELLGQADEALYTAKKNSRSGIIVYNKEAVTS